MNARSAFTWGLTWLAGLTLGLASASNAADDDEKGFVKLFSGADLKGWSASEGVEWKVEEGCIVTPPKRSHLFTEGEYTNFHFKAEVLTTSGSNSGIYFHTQPEETWPSHGYESQVNTTHKDPVKTGSIYNVVKLYDAASKDDEWYTHEIIVKGKNIVVKINGKTVVDFTEPPGVTGTRKLGKGRMALQAHDPQSVVRYRNIRIQPLP